MYVKRPPASFPQVGEDRGILGRCLAGEGLKGLHGDNPRGDLGGLTRDRGMRRKHSAEALSVLTQFCEHRWAHHGEVMDQDFEQNQGLL